MLSLICCYNFRQFTYKCILFDVYIQSWKYFNTLYEILTISFLSLSIASSIVVRLVCVRVAVLFLLFIVCLKLSVALTRFL